MKTTEIKAGDLLVSLVQSSEGILLESLQDLKENRQMFSSNASLFTLQVKNLESGNVITTTSGTGWKTTSISAVATDKYMLCLSDNPDIAGVAVTLFATVSQNRISWKMFLQNSSPVFSLIECDYPAITFEAKDTIRIFRLMAAVSIICQQEKADICQRKTIRLTVLRCNTLLFGTPKQGEVCTAVLTTEHLHIRRFIFHAQRTIMTLRLK